MACTFGLQTAPEPAEEAEEDSGPDLEELLALAREEGRQEGHAAAEREAQAREEALQVQVQERLSEAIAALEREAEQLRRHAGAFALELARSVAQHLLDRELSAAPAEAVTLVETVLAETRDLSTVHLRVAPATAEFLRQEAATGHPALQGVEIEADETLKAGDCVVSDRRHEIVAHVDGRIRRIIEQSRAPLLEAFEDAFPLELESALAGDLSPLKGESAPATGESAPATGESAPATFAASEQGQRPDPEALAPVRPRMLVRQDREGALEGGP